MKGKKSEVLRSLRFYTHIGSLNRDPARKCFKFELNKIPKPHLAPIGLEKSAISPR
jgi:hypothetical protein